MRSAKWVLVGLLWSLFLLAACAGPMRCFYGPTPAWDHCVPEVSMREVLR